MRRSWVLFILFLAACGKHSPTPDSGCITRVFPAPSALNAGQMDTIRTLFKTNGLSTDTFTGYGYATAQLVFTILNHITVDSVPDSVQEVIAQLYFNGLPSQFIQEWDFDGGRLNGPAPAQYQNLHTSDTAARLPLAYLRSAFLSIAPADIVSGMYDYGPYNFHDSCLSATLIYVPAAYFGGNTPGNLLVRGWAITTEDGQIPMVFVDDENGVVQPAPHPCPECEYLY